MRFILLIGVFCLIAGSCEDPAKDKSSPIPEKLISEYKDEASQELPEGTAKELVVNNCVHCHSHKIITQNRATREGWQSMIIWMQQSQGLWPLGTAEEDILDYLEEHFAPENKGRRAPLTDIEWYELGI